MENSKAGTAIKAPLFTAKKVLRPRQQVEEQIRLAILSGEVRRGDRLPSETELATQFSVSRPTVREALAALAEKGFIRRTPGARGGSFVEYVDVVVVGEAFSERLSTTLEVGSLTYEEVAEFRDLLEVPSARLAAVHATEEHIEQLREVIEREKSRVVDDPHDLNLNRDFHVRIADASGNRLLKTFVAELHRLTRPIHYIQWTPEIGLDGIRHHIAIVRGIRHHDPEAAAEAMREHLEYLRAHTA